VIAAFSARYLEGEPRQRQYVRALAGVVVAVHLLLMANHWVVLIGAWTLVGIALQHLLCFYADRPFALLAAHKKQIADRLADALLLAAAGLAWHAVGSGSLTDLWAHLAQQGMSTELHISAVCLVLAVILRTALLPVHGWLIQVMEAPTPVSALLHAGVVNLGGFVLILFAPLLEQAMFARTLLVVFGLATAVLAGLVMLTRISIKVRLAWSTAAQMGFMVLECGLGLYTLAALHLIGHSLYKAHVFLSASMVVRHTRLQSMGGANTPTPFSLLLAPVLAVSTVYLLQSFISASAWPWWWSTVLGLAWAPLLWLQSQHTGLRAFCVHVGAGLLMVAGLTLATLLAHALPLGVQDSPSHTLGVPVLIAMGTLYLFLVALQLWPHALRSWWRWSYAGFYVDEVYTRLTLYLWPSHWGANDAAAQNASARV
jgi:NAD(P)H-quinone oxidoreductase subunit 5